ncbi:MAG: hypothetical protein KDA41_11935, partial [Planctomycetales bacterium]|nr:hypothetical protein [Planctomycetales bacterium]
MNFFAPFCIALGCLAADAAPQTEAPSYEPTSHYQLQDIEGWRVYVNKRLLEDKAQQATGTAALKLLREELREIVAVTPPKRLPDLRAIPVWLEVDNT